MLTIFIRAIVLYSLTIVTLRAMGKHQLGQFQPYEFAMALMIADLMSTPIGDISTPLMHGVLPVAALFIVHSVLTLLCMRSDRIRAIVSGKPAVVVSRGIIDKKQLTRLCFSLSDLLEGLREAGILDVSGVGTAIVEADGSLSAFPCSSRRGVSTEDLEIKTHYEGMPQLLVLDGRAQKNNLAATGKDEKWLSGLLKQYNLDIERVLLASLDTQGKMHLQDMRGATLNFRAMAPEEVIW